MRSIFSGGELTPAKETDPAVLEHMNVASVRRARVANYVLCIHCHVRLEAE